MKRLSIFKHEIPLKAKRVESKSVSPEKEKDTLTVLIKLAGLILFLKLWNLILENGYFTVYLNITHIMFYKQPL